MLQTFASVVHNESVFCVCVVLRRSSVTDQSNGIARICGSSKLSSFQVSSKINQKESKHFLRFQPNAAGYSEDMNKTNNLFLRLGVTLVYPPLCLRKQTCFQHLYTRSFQSVAGTQWVLLKEGFLGFAPDDSSEVYEKFMKNI